MNKETKQYLNDNLFIRQFLDDKEFDKFCAKIEKVTHKALAKTLYNSETLPQGKCCAEFVSKERMEK